MLCDDAVPLGLIIVADVSDVTDADGDYDVGVAVGGGAAGIVDDAVVAGFDVVAAVGVVADIAVAVIRDVSVLVRLILVVGGCIVVDVAGVDATVPSHKCLTT